MLPASAWMILTGAMRAPIAFCAPRIRGDDPSYPVHVIVQAKCSPHPRG